MATTTTINAIERTIVQQDNVDTAIVKEVGYLLINTTELHFMTTKATFTDTLTDMDTILKMYFIDMIDTIPIEIASEVVDCLTVSTICLSMQDTMALKPTLFHHTHKEVMITEVMNEAMIDTKLAIMTV